MYQFIRRLIDPTQPVVGYTDKPRSSKVDSDTFQVSCPALHFWCSSAWFWFVWHPHRWSCHGLSEGVSRKRRLYRRTLRMFPRILRSGLYAKYVAIRFFYVVFDSGILYIDAEQCTQCTTRRQSWVKAINSRYSNVMNMHVFVVQECRLERGRGREGVIWTRYLDCQFQRWLW